MTWCKFQELKMYFKLCICNLVVVRAWCLSRLSRVIKNNIAAYHMDKIIHPPTCYRLDNSTELS